MTAENGRYYAIGEKLKSISAGSLCELVGKLCLKIKTEVGSSGYRGGIFPGNITLDMDREPCLGPASEKDWSGEELLYLPPELFWHGEKSAAGDVYSLGLVLYYASVGSLPFESENTDPEKARQKRLAGAEIKVPVDVNRRLREIILKATAFKSADRYATPGELKAALDSCVENVYVKSDELSESIFNKSSQQLSGIELMMLQIVAESEKDKKTDEDLMPELAEEEITQEPAEPEESGEPEEPAESEEPEEPEVPEEFAAEPEAEIPSEEELTEEAPSAEELTGEEEVSGTEAASAENDEDMTIAPEMPKEKPADEHIPIPILVEEQNPELEPVVPEKVTRSDGVRYDRRIEQEHRIKAEVQKRRRRPVLFILILCTLVILAALIFNELNGDSGIGLPSALLSDPTPTPTLPVIITPQLTPTPEPTPTPVEAQPQKSVYTLYYEDVSWQTAQQRCIEMGGHLVTIADEDEFNEIASLANDKGATYIWIGCHRSDGTLIWENGESVDYYRWDYNEPSYYDGNIQEDYVMLWNHNGAWCYNDSRSDLLEESYEYSGKIAFICETYE